MAKFYRVFSVSVLLLVALGNCQNEEFDSALGADLSSLPTEEIALVSTSRQGGPIGVGLASAPPVIPPQNNPVSPFEPGGGPLGPNGLPPGFVPFGLNHIILIVVPTFKAKFHKLPSWLHSNVKVSMPITVFFDQLNVPPGMFSPGLVGGLPFLGIPPPIGLPPPFPVGPLAPPGRPLIPPAAGSAIATNAPTIPGYAYDETKYGYGDSSGYDADPDSQQADTEEGYEDSYYPEEEQKRRRKRAIFSNQTLNQNPKYTFNETIHSSERAALMPKLETLLENAGFGGKPCLLRALCEVHEAPLDHYGLLGELFTLFFSVSRSAFAESHLPEYLRAESLGKLGDCTEYFRHCKHTIFSWEEVKRTKKAHKTKQRPFIVNVIDEVL